MILDFDDRTNIRKNNTIEAAILTPFQKKIEMVQRHAFYDKLYAASPINKDRQNSPFR